MNTIIQKSAGGVAYRVRNDQIEIAVISVGESNRWQLPKGRVDEPESTEAAAMREVREEAGLDTELLSPIETIDYWFYAGPTDKRVRVHKFVSFFLLKFLDGDPKDHDHEVNEARWMEIDEAWEKLAFETEKEVVAKAKQMIASLKNT